MRPVLRMLLKSARLEETSEEALVRRAQAGESEAFRALFELMPELAVVGEPDRLRSSFVNGIKRMTVRV